MIIPFERSVSIVADYLRWFVSDERNRSEYVVIRFHLNHICADTNTTDVSGRGMFFTAYDLLALVKTRPIEEVLLDLYSVVTDMSLNGPNGKMIKFLLKLVPEDTQLHFTYDLMSMYAQFNDKYQIVTNGRIIKIKNNEGNVLFKTSNTQKARIFLKDNP